jgi:hypothetical protein
MSTRVILFVTWITFVILDLAVVILLYIPGYIEQQDFTMAIEKLNLMFAPYLSTIVAFFFSKKQPALVKSGAPFAVAMVCTLLWNLINFILLVKLLWGSGTIQESFATIASFSNLFQWLVPASIVYYFGKS